MDRLKLLHLNMIQLTVNAFSPGLSNKEPAFSILSTTFVYLSFLSIIFSEASIVRKRPSSGKTFSTQDHHQVLLGKHLGFSKWLFVSGRLRAKNSSFNNHPVPRHDKRSMPMLKN